MGFHSPIEVPVPGLSTACQWFSRSELSIVSSVWDPRCYSKWGKRFNPAARRYSYALTLGLVGILDHSMNICAD
jgi:hypothetical protein